MIETVNKQGEGYLVNGSISVPKADGNKDYEAVKKWIDDGGIVGAEFTQAELDEQAVSAKWTTLTEYLGTLTVQREATDTEPAGNKFNVSPSGVLNITEAINVMTELDIKIWYEDWGNFEVSKVDLQEALTLRQEAKDAKLLELFGGL